MGLRQEAHFSYHENTTTFILEAQAAWLGCQHSAQPDQLQQPAQLQQSMDSMAGAENPYRLMQVFGRGHQVTRNGDDGVCDQVSGDGGPPEDSHQLH
jgi:hypothetical protein